MNCARSVSYIRSFLRDKPPFLKAPDHLRVMSFPEATALTGRWESPRLAVGATVTVPHRAYYNISFGYSTVIRCVSKAGSKRKRADNTPSSSSASVAATAVEYHLLVMEDEEEASSSETPSAAAAAVENDNETTITPRNDTNNNTAPTSLSSKRTRQFVLPWREDTSQNPQILDPPSLHLGKLIWLEPQSRLSVRCVSQAQEVEAEQSTRDICDETTAASDGDDDDDDCSSDEILQWQVQLQSVQEERPKNDPKRSWICTICRKGFLSAWSVSQHQDVAHYDQVNPESTSSLSSIWTTPLETVYNDDYLAVIIKPQSMAVMGDFGGKTLLRSSLLMALMPPAASMKIQGKPKFAWPQKAESTKTGDESNSTNNGSTATSEKAEESEQKLDSYFGKPRPAHRLDAPTGGLLVVAKTKRTESALKRSFAQRTVHKTYRALVYGKMEKDEGECPQDLSGKPSLTRYSVLRRSRSVTSQDGWLTTVELYPHTGRMHQLRKHMQMLGHPMWGDKRYGPNQKDTSDDEWQSRLCLWAVAIRLPHPVFFPINGKNIDCRMHDPEWLDKVVKHEEETWQKANNLGIMLEKD